MANDLRSDEGVGGFDEETRRSTRRTGVPETSELSGPVADREVPLGREEQDGRALAPAIHAWLDGEAPESSVRKPELARDVDFWKAMNAETQDRRSIRRPMGLEARIMSALPHAGPGVTVRADVSWYEQDVVLSPMTAATAGVALVAAGAALAAVAIKLKNR